MIGNFRVYINKIWLSVNPSFENFKIKKVRDNKDLLVNRVVSGSVITFKCTEFDILKTFAKKGEDIDVQFTEYDCNRNDLVGYEGFLTFDNKIDYENKILEATVTIKDEYYELFANRNNINSQLEIPLPIFSDSLRRISCYNSFQDNSMTTAATPLNWLLNYYLKIFIGLDASLSISIPVDFSNKMICENSKFLNKFNNKKVNSEQPVFNYSLNDILTFLRDNFFLHYYIKNNTFYLAYYRDYVRPDTIDLTTTLNERIVEISQEKYKERSYKKPDIKAEYKINYIESKKTDIEKVSLQGSVSTVKTNAENTRQPTFLIIDSVKYDEFDIETQQAILSLSPISSQFDAFKVLENQFVDGDFSELVMTNRVNTTKALDVYTREMYLIENEKLGFFFNIKEETAFNSFKSLYFRIYRLNGDSPDINADTLIYNRQVFEIAIESDGSGGFNVGDGINITIPENNWYYCVLHMRGDTSDASVTIKNFDLFFDKNYIFSAKSFGGGRPNDYLSLERFIKTKGVDFQNDTIELRDGTLSTVLPKDFATQEITLRQPNLLQEFNFEAIYKTELGNFKAYEIEETHTKVDKTYSKLTLKANKNDLF